MVMSESHPPPSRPVTVGQLISESGRTASPRMSEFLELASAVQRDRLTRGASDTRQITRSSALWALMTVDSEIRHALQNSGVNLGELGDTLSLTSVPHLGTREIAEVHDEFAIALSDYLRGLPDQRQVVDLVDVAIAILNSSQNSSRGLLPKRLNRMRVSYAAAVDSLLRLVPEEQTKADLPELSGSMRGVANDLPPAEITAFTIAKAIAGRHREYAGGQLGTAALDEPGGAMSQSWPDWYESVARRFTGANVAGSRHEVIDGRLFLFGLALVDPALQKVLQRDGVWGSLVMEIDEAVAQPGSVLWSVLNGLQFAYGYDSDRATEQDDQLGIQGEVNAVCEVIIDRKVKPPLSIGLFGEWGAGKSFFMEKMRERIAERTQRRGELAVRQIRFNAWHYTDTSLWASLAIEIFERLADPEPVSAEDRDRWLGDHGDVHRAEREKLLTQLETYRDAKSALDAECSQLEVERLLLAKRRDEASQKRGEAIEKASLTEVAVEVARNPDVRAALAGVSNELGLEPAVDDLADLGKELRTTAGYLPGIWRVARHKTWSVALIAAFVVLALATAALAIRGGFAWLAPLAGSVGSIAAVATLIRPAARKVNKALGHIEAAVETASRVRAELRTRRGREERALELELAEADREIAKMTGKIVSLDEKIVTTEAAAKALSVGRKLYDFLNDRAAGYQKHQGVVGMLHRDFRFLDAQLRADQNSAQGPLPRIDRVVLYIDDLDRCPPAKVLEVLEAVHLLLALELFVVVVGVDPRWLQRSLRHQYRDLVAGGDPRADPYLRGMPIEYLEKIFQIPLTLPVMEPPAYARLIASLAPSVDARPPRETHQPTTHRAVPDESTGGDRGPTRAPLDVQPGSAASGDIGERIDLTRPEVECAQRLGGLVDSPRAAKRLMNTYRLIRATQHVGSRSRFLGGDGRPGEYQAVLTLLAVTAGHPSMADRLLVALQDTAGAGIRTWPDFVAGLDPGYADRAGGSLLPADLAGQPSELAGWTSLHSGLTAGLQATTLDDLEPYRRWGRIVARFSFTL